MIIKTLKCLVCTKYYSGLDEEKCPNGCDGKVLIVYEQEMKRKYCECETPSKGWCNKNTFCDCCGDLIKESI